MKLSVTQRKMALLGVGLLLAVAILLGGVHHHDGDHGCWFCLTAAFCVLAVAVLALFAPKNYATLIHVDVTPIPSWFLWVTHRHRGPPARHG